MGRKQYFNKTHKDKNRHKYQRKQIRVKFRVNLVIGFLGVIPLESVSDNLVEEETVTDPKDNGYHSEE